MPVTPTASVSMREFLRSGKFGPIQLGDSADSLTAVFGEPHRLGGTSRRHRVPRIWNYGDVEFHLTDDAKRIRLIFSDHFESLTLGAGASLERWFFEGHPSVESVEGELKSANIAFEKRAMPHTDDLFLLRLESGVELLFSAGTDSSIWPGVPGLFGFQHVYVG